MNGINDFSVFLSGGDFGGATVSVPGDTIYFYVYSGDIINIYHVNPLNELVEHIAEFILDETDVTFNIPDNAFSVELTWNEDKLTWQTN